MLPRVRGRRTVAWCCLAATVGTAACGDDARQDEAPERTAADHAGPADPASDPAAISARLAEPAVPDLLEALAQPHADLRSALGPHRLDTVTDFELAAPASAQAEPTLPAVDAPVVQPHAVHDELTLVWLEPDEAGPRLSLSQHNDHDRGRDVIVLGETIHVRQQHRPWVHYTRDSNLLERWLDDAQSSVHDAVQLAAPRLSLQSETIPGGGLRGGDGVEITLGLADEIDTQLAASGPTRAWRGEVQLDAVEGVLRLDASTGAWVTAEIDVRYHLLGADERRLEGRLHLRGTLSPDPDAAVTAPTDSRPLPTRVRYDQEMRELLDGLAAP